MARVSIEERAAAGAKKLAREMGWKKLETIGRLYFFWHDSQELEQITCTLEDLSLWMELKATDKPKIVDAMIGAGFLKREYSGELYIIGNQKHIENLKQRRSSGSVGGKRSGEVRSLKAVSQQSKIEAHASSENEAYASSERLNETEAHNEPSSLQFSAVQFSAIQEKKDTPPGKKLVELWQDNCGEMRKVLQVGPDRMQAVRKALEDNPDLEFWRQAIGKMAGNPFFQGKNKRGWRGTFDFLIAPGNAGRVLEGAYDGPQTESAIDWSRYGS